MRTKTFKICFLHLDKSLHLVECLVLGLQVREVLRDLDRPQLVAHLVRDMDLGTIMEQVALGLDTEAQVILVADLNVVNIQLLVILEVDNMPDILEVNSHQVLRALDTPLVQAAIHLVLEVHPTATHLVDPLEERRLVLTQDLEVVLEPHPLLSQQKLHLQVPIPPPALPQLIQHQLHHPQHLPHPLQPPPPPSRPLQTRLLLHLLSQGLRVLPPHTLAQQALHRPTTPHPTRHMALVLPLQALVVLLLAMQGKDSLVVIQVGALLLLEATWGILEDLAALHQVTLGVAALQECLDLAILVGDPILPLKGATRHTGIPREDLEDIHRQGLGIQATDLLAVRWGLQVVLLQDQGVPLPPKELGWKCCAAAAVHIWLSFQF